MTSKDSSVQHSTKVAKVRLVVGHIFFVTHCFFLINCRYLSRYASEDVCV